MKVRAKVKLNGEICIETEIDNRYKNDREWIKNKIENEVYKALHISLNIGVDDLKIETMEYKNENTNNVDIDV